MIAFQEVCGFPYIQGSPKTASLLKGFVFTEENSMPANYQKFKLIAEVRDMAWACRENKPKRKWHVEKLIKEKSLTVLYADGGTGKTYITLSLAVCAASGRDWLGYKIPRGLVTLFVDEESDEDDLGYRFQACIKGEELEGDGLPIHFISGGGFTLDNPEAVQALRCLIVANKAELVIIDSFSMILNGDENTKEDCQVVMRELRRLCNELGCSIVVIHHANKADGYRGSTAIKNSINTLIKVESTIIEQNESRASTLLKFSTKSGIGKTRDFAGSEWCGMAVWSMNALGEAVGYRLQFADNIVHKPEKNKPYLTPSQEYVLSFLSSHSDAPLSQIKNNAAICKSRTAERAVYDLAKEGLVVRSNSGAGGVEAQYSITLVGAIQLASKDS
jgi:hypothetical protein